MSRRTNARKRRREDAAPRRTPARRRRVRRAAALVGLLTGLGAAGCGAGGAGTPPAGETDRPQVPGDAEAPAAGTGAATASAGSGGTAVPAGSGSTAPAAGIGAAAPAADAAGGGPGVVNDRWRILRMATAHDIMTIEVEVADLDTAPEVARALVAPIADRYAEVLVYVYAAGESAGGHLPATRFEWTAAGGLAAVDYRTNGGR